MIKLTLIFEAEPSRVLDLKPGAYQLGRSESNAIPVSHPTVSSEHCRLTVHSDYVHVRDLNSTNGTYINDRQITEGELLPGYYLRVGDIEAYLHGEPPVVAIPSYQEASQVAVPVAYHMCVNHRSVAAAYGCSKCQVEYCALCVHQIRRVGGTPLLLCPKCSDQCQPLVRQHDEGKQSLWKTLRQALNATLRR